MSKLEKSIKNARVAFAFYFVTLVVSFVSRKVFIDTLGTELVGLSSTMPDEIQKYGNLDKELTERINWNFFKKVSIYSRHKRIFILLKINPIMKNILCK